MSSNKSVHIFTPTEPRMGNEAERLRTLQGWPTSASTTATDLAKAGFYYIGPEDTVRCYCCGGTHRHWLPGDCPWAVHRRLFPTCDFIQETCLGNIPRLLSVSDAVDGQLLSLLQKIAVQELAMVGQPVHPDMEQEDSRLVTFRNWSTGTPVRPQVLARAGFFYTGHNDNVKCFYCDGNLRNWEPGDDPWQEHAKWFPRCEFLLQAKGYEYVRGVQESYFHSSTAMGGLPAASTTEQPAARQGAVAGRGRAQHHARSEVPSGPGSSSAEQQLHQLQVERTCKVCMDKPVSIVFIPCGHLVACADCAASLQNCPICRAIIRGSVRTFMS